MSNQNAKLTVREHLERAWTILKDPAGFLPALVRANIPIREQVIPFFILFCILELSVKLVLVIFTHHTLGEALYWSIFGSLAAGIGIALIALLLMRLENYTELRGSFAQYFAALVYGATAALIANVFANFFPIISWLGIFSGYLVCKAFEGLKAGEPQHHKLSDNSRRGAFAAVGLLVWLLLLIPSTSNPMTPEAKLRRDQERLFLELQKIFEQSQQVR